MRVPLLIVTCALLVTACAVEPAVMVAHLRTGSTPQTAATTSQELGVGSSMRVSEETGATYAVTVAGIDDPAKPSDLSQAPEAGTHLVSIVLNLTGVKGDVKDDADNCLAVIGANRETYTPSFDDTTAGTDFNDGAFVLTPGQTLSGAVTFDIPNGVDVHMIQFAPDSGFGNTIARWVVG